MMELDRNQAYGIKPFTIPMVTTRLPVIDSFMTKKIGHTHFKIPNPHSNQKNIWCRILFLKKRKHQVL